MAWCPRAFFFVPLTEREAVAEGHFTVSAPTAHCDGSPMTVRGGGVPLGPWLQCRTKEWVRRLGASLRCATLHHGWGPWARRIQGCSTILRAPHAGSPLIVIPTLPACCRARSCRGVAWPWWRVGQGRSDGQPRQPLRATASGNCGSGEETALNRAKKLG
jgi:hypothetical protein